MIRTVNYKEYICDCCKKKSRGQDFLNEIKIPAKNSTDTVKFEVCLDCLDKIYKTLEQRFVIIYGAWGENIIKER